MSPTDNPSDKTKGNSPRVTTKTLQRMRQDGQLISMLTAYDFPTAEALDDAGLDVLLVGDSVAMVVQGHETTLPVTMDQMLYHAEMVGRAAKRALVVVDLPFPEGQLEINRSIEASARVLKETKCHAVKLEGGAEQASRIQAIVTAGIPVMAHVGLRPQNVHVEGGYRIKREAEQLIADAIAAEKAGDRARGSVLASDAFFPFPDGVERALEAGVTAFIQPGGSRNDGAVIEAADKAGAAMVVTGARHFRH